MDFTRVNCKLRDCAYYHAVGENVELCDCSHPDKPFYMSNPCPLYRKDLMKQQSSDKAEELKNRFLKRR
jgi:hypothetical protein